MGMQDRTENSRSQAIRSAYTNIAKDVIVLLLSHLPHPVHPHIPFSEPGQQLSLRAHSGAIVAGRLRWLFGTKQRNFSGAVPVLRN